MTVEIIKFEKPSGFLIGVATAFVIIKNSRVQIAHAFLNIDGNNEITIYAPRYKLTPENVIDIANKLNEFIKEIK